MPQFFARMEHLYGHRWTTNYGKAVNGKGELTLAAKQWAHDLADFPPHAILRAMKRLESEYREWPPTVPQFKALCLDLPTLAQVLDRKNDYGPACAEIRKSLDWFNLDQMPTKEMLRQAQWQYERAANLIDRSGLALDFLDEQREAIEAAA